MPYDPLADFTHIHLVGTFPTVLAVNASSPITSVKELVDMARAKPGEVTYGSGGNGTMNHLIGQLLVRETGVKFETTPDWSQPAVSRFEAPFAQVALSSPKTSSSQIE